MATLMSEILLLVTYLVQILPGYTLLHILLKYAKKYVTWKWYV